MINKILLFVLTICLSFIYFRYSKNIPFSYYDEFWWVNDSYLAQYYFNGDFTNPVWNSNDAIDQPMMTRLIFAASLYPKYIKEKSQISLTSKRVDYTFSKFLINNGFLYSETNNAVNYEYYLDNIKRFALVDYDFVGFESDFIDKYGKSVSYPLELVKTIRMVNSLFLALAIVILFRIMVLSKDIKFSVIFTLLLAFNPILIQSSLKAHSEASLFLTLSLFLFVLHKYSEKPNLYKIIVLSIIIGFMVSIKLSGAILYPILIIIISSCIMAKNIRIYLVKLIKNLLLSIGIVFTTFVIINPYTLSSPISNSVKMFVYRDQIMNSQIKYYKNEALFNVSQRLEALYMDLFPKTYGNLLGQLMVIVFILGIYDVGKNLTHTKKIVNIMFVSLAVFLTVYILLFSLNWVRYLVTFIPFVTYFEVTGIFYITKSLSTANYLKFN
jgi:hypothetical protein